MLTKSEELALQAIIEDLQYEFLETIEENDFEFIGTAARHTQRELEELFRRVQERKQILLNMN